MNQKITKNEVKDILNIVLCISAKDGVLSDTEIEKSLEEFPHFFDKKITKNELNLIVDNFFNSNDQIEEYLDRITDDDMKPPILQLAIISASADGLDIRENFAFQKALTIWEIELKDIS
jgi:hypothetical protein